MPGRRRTNPLVCRYKQLRSTPRRFSARDVGRIACKARQNGYTVDAILQETAECAPCESRKRRRRIEQRELSVLQDSSNLYESTITTLEAASLAIDGILLLARFFPVFRAPAAAASLAKRQLVALQVRVRTQKAANDELYSDLSREFFQQAA